MLVKTQFTIKDLENLSNVKAHTIRIWEKRYNLLNPDRTDTNIRQYSLEDLKKLLNVSFLYEKGYKISKIAKLKASEITAIIKDLKKSDTNQVALKNFKSAMLSFDETLFHQTYSELIQNKTFQEIFMEIFIPLLDEIGILWQTNTINPAHEHFISELVKRKILLNIELVDSRNKPEHERLFCLFLPENEIHDIGLLYANYELKLEGYKTIFLGGNIPLSNLKHIAEHYDNPIFISYFTVAPESDKFQEFMVTFKNEVGNYEFWILGSRMKRLKDGNDHKNLNIFESITAFQKKLKSLNIS